MNYMPNLNNNQIIQSLWIGDKLSTMERLCIESYLQNGHEFHLYVYSDVKQMPSGAQVKDANLIIASENIFQDSSGGFAAFSDWFRYQLLYLKGGWWVDMDSVCLQYFDISKDYCFCTERSKGFEQIIGSAFVKAPAKAPFLKELLKYMDGVLTTQKTVMWGEFGPHLLNIILKSYDSKQFIKRPEVFCPINWFETYQLVSLTNYIPAKETYAIHLWNERWRLELIDKDATHHYRR